MCVYMRVCVQWVPEIRHHCPATPFLVVGTKVELRDDPATIEKLANQKLKPVSHEAGEKLCRDLKGVKYLECSALTQKGSCSSLICLLCSCFSCTSSFAIHRSYLSIIPHP